jgi:hypothetical protein
MHLRVPLLCHAMCSCSQQGGERRVVSQRSAAVSMTTYGGDEMVDVDRVRNQGRQEEIESESPEGYRYL